MARDSSDKPTYYWRPTFNQISNILDEFSVYEQRSLGYVMMQDSAGGESRALSASEAQAALDSDPESCYLVPSCLYLAHLLSRSIIAQTGRTGHNETVRRYYASIKGRFDSPLGKEDWPAWKADEYKTFAQLLGRENAVLVAALTEKLRPREISQEAIDWFDQCKTSKRRTTNFVGTALSDASIPVATTAEEKWISTANPNGSKTSSDKPSALDLTITHASVQAAIRSLKGDVAWLKATYPDVAATIPTFRAGSSFKLTSAYDYVGAIRASVKQVFESQQVKDPVTKTCAEIDEGDTKRLLSLSVSLRRLADQIKTLSGIECGFALPSAATAQGASR